MKQKFFTRIVCVVLAATLVITMGLVAISSISADAVSAGASGYISDDYVNLRSGAGTSYSIVTCMRKNTKCTFVDGKLYNSSWYKIKLSTGDSGYVNKSYVAVSATTTASSGTGYINSDYVNLRSGAGTSYSVLTCMRKNTTFNFVDSKLYNSVWYKIKLSTGTTGYVHKNYVTVSTSATTTPATTAPSTSATTGSTTVTGYVNADYVNLRNGAGTSYSIVTCMRKNTNFTFLSTSLYNSSWYHIKLSDGKTGYISKTYATKNSTTGGTVTKPSNLSLKISDTSETLYVGNNYVLYVTGATSVKWSSSDTSVATVDKNGVITAKKSGTATITATSGSSSVKCKITVKSGTSVNITTTNISAMSSGRSVLLKSSTSGVKWKTSNSAYATVDSGIVTAKKVGYVTITAYTSSGAASCLIYIQGRDPVRSTYASPNSASLNSTVKFYAITDTDRTAVRFVVSNGSTSYTIDATNKVMDGENYLWSASKKLSKSGVWTIKAYAMFKNSGKYSETPIFGEGEVFVTSSTDTTTTVCSERRASDEVIKLIANYEGLLSTLTPDNITSDPTVGYGKVITAGEQFYNNLTANAAYAYLVKTVNSGGYTTKTNSFLLDNNIKFNQQQFDALVCFAYNVGASAIYNDSDLQSVLLNTGSTGAVKAGAGGYVNASDVNLRSGAGTSYSVLTCMSKNTKFTFVDGKVYNTNWYKIKLSDGTTGYIYKSYASVSSSTRDLNNVDKQNYIDNFLQYHHAAGDCYWGLLYRRVDEAEVFFYGDYTRDGQNNKNNIKFSCKNGGISIS